MSKASEEQAAPRRKASEEKPVAVREKQVHGDGDWNGPVPDFLSVGI